jgi:hypothetical protein
MHETSFAGHSRQNLPDVESFALADQKELEKNGKKERQ